MNLLTDMSKIKLGGEKPEGRESQSTMAHSAKKDTRARLKTNPSIHHWPVAFVIQPSFFAHISRHKQLVLQSCDPHDTRTFRLEGQKMGSSSLRRFLLYFKSEEFKENILKNAEMKL